MGANLKTGQYITSRIEDRLRFILKVSAQQQQSLREIVRQRSNFKNQYLCSVQRLESIDHQAPNIFCQNYNQVAIQYQPYDILLSDIDTNTQPLPQVEIQRIIYSVCSALQFLQTKKHRHGDISPKMICRSKSEWRLVDNYFIKGGITAYQKVLEGEVGFISPAQMQKIRHGFVRQSPPIEQSDDVFALGMTCLEIMSGRPSSSCYKQSYIRFNQKNLNDSKAVVQYRYPAVLGTLVFAMIDPNEQKRIKVGSIMSNIIINRHSKKYSLRSYSK